ncbi:MAG: hypothetical protein CVV51_12365, partial [Spirochaetae bacterium HGW-Spirochaetae-7]
MTISAKPAVLAFTFLLGVASASSQTPFSPPSGASPALAATAPAALAVPAETVAVPRSFRKIELGMTMDAVKEVLASDGLFSYRGDVDVSLLPRPDESLIEVSGLSFVRRAFFQFYSGKLFVMIFLLNEKEIDHYSVFTSMSDKYGKPGNLSPSESVWSDAATRLSVERPLAVKYIDMAVFDALKAAGASEVSM